MTTFGTLWLPLALHPLLVVGQWLSPVVSLLAVVLALLWGWVLLGPFRTGTTFWQRLKPRLREWGLPVGFVAAGVVLILAGGDCLGQALDSTDMTIQRWFLEWWESTHGCDGPCPMREGTPLPVVSATGGEGGCGHPGLVVQGCPQ